MDVQDLIEDVCFFVPWGFEHPVEKGSPKQRKLARKHPSTP